MATPNETVQFVSTGEFQEERDRRGGRLADYEPQRADAVAEFVDREAGGVLTSIRDPGEQRRDVLGGELSRVAQFPQWMPEMPFNGPCRAKGFG
ncbi:hypothetical protein [Streptomyces sp. BK340]|uniref:hypothetical protein n=1 Tax=Streptomyces sp. BK340 TaxID=2572903 RepID=UPI0011ADEA5A|nr:hypothetical protein [Streptomyces sp. BK340]TVZ99526.1 hypothetical protein FB157_101543 [Streptomyces sp. BK340]